MDLIPTPGQVLAASGNVTRRVLYGSIADLRPMPRTLIHQAEHSEVYHYRPRAGVDPTGDPVLLVTPLAAPSLCFDLRRGCSLVEHLVDEGRPTYLVEYGEVHFGDRALGMEHWVDEVVPAAIRAASEHAGGRPVHVVGWSLGGIFALLAAADRPDLPLASLSVAAAPVDTRSVPIIAPPRPLVRWAAPAPSIQRLIAKPLAVVSHLDDREFLAQIEAVDRFTAQMAAYPGRTFGQLYHRFIKGNALRHGSYPLGRRTIDLAAISVPVLVLGGESDAIAPAAAVEAVVPLLTGAPDVRSETVPGGHLAMIAGRGARETTWRLLDEWFEEWSGHA